MRNQYITRGLEDIGNSLNNVILILYFVTEQREPREIHKIVMSGHRTNSEMNADGLPEKTGQRFADRISYKFKTTNALSYLKRL